MTKLTKSGKPDGRGKNPNSRKNLKTFSKENQPPPEVKGPKKGSKHISTIIKEILESQEIIVNPITKEKQNCSQAEILVLALVAKGRKGDVRAFKELADRVYGQAEENINFNLNEQKKKIAEIEENMTVEEATRIYKDMIKKSTGEQS